MTDASNAAIKFQPAETRYSTFDRELLAVCLPCYQALPIFSRGSYISCSHGPQTPHIRITSSPRPRHTSRQCRHLDYISQFITDLRHICGIDNSVADAQLRIEANALTQNSLPVVNFHVMAEAQRKDSELKTLLANPGTSSLQMTQMKH